MYCNWGVKPVNDGFLLPAIHKKYLDEFSKHSSSRLVLLSIVLPANYASEDLIFVPTKEIELVTLPSFTNYVSAFFHFYTIAKKILHVSKKADFFYIRTFEPFSWIFSLIKSNSIINYHFISNPFEAIWGNYNDSVIKKIVRSILFFPEFLFICVAAYFNQSTCNGPSVLKHIPFFLRKKIHVTYESTIDEDSFYTLEEKSTSDRVRALSVGYLRHAKGIPFLISGFKLFKEQNPNINIYLTIVGDGESRESIKELIKNYNLNDYIRLSGHLGKDQLKKEYQNHDVLIMPSLSETGPRVILEAMANSLYCISTDVGYVKKLLGGFADNINGKIIKKKSSEDIANSLLWYVENRDDANIQIQEAFKKSQTFTLANFTKEILKKRN